MTLKTAIAKRNIKEIRNITSSTPAALVADMLEELDDKERLIYFRLLDQKLQAEVFSSLEDDYQEKLIQSFNNDDMKEILQELHADEIADLVEEVPKDIAERILKHTPKNRIAYVKKILRYEDNVVGSFMMMEILSLKRTYTVGQALQLIKSKRKEVFVDKFIFVTDGKNRLVGYVTIDDIMFLANTKKISKIYKPCGFLYTTTNEYEAINAFADYDMSVLPVIDKTKKLVGVVTADDMIDVAQEVADADFQKMAGIDYDDTPYSRMTTKKLFKSRVLWLLLLMISSTISQIVLDAFQGIAHSSLDSNAGTITSSAIWTTALVAILPVISGAAGNAGSQSSTMVIRALATGDIGTKDYLKVMLKEFKVSSFIGFSLGIANFLRLLLYYIATGDISSTSGTDYIFLSLAASLALFVVIVLAKVVGGTLPLIAKAFKLDPAVMAAPLLTTLIDALSTMIFFGISIGIMILVI